MFVLACDQDDIKELKRQLTLHNHQIDAMKEELSLKEAMISKGRMDKINVEKELAKLKVHNIKMHWTFNRKWQNAAR